MFVSKRIKTLIYLVRDRQILSFKSTSPYLGSDKFFPLTAAPMVKKLSILCSLISVTRVMSATPMLLGTGYQLCGGD